VEVQSALDADLSVRFYRIEQDLTVDVERLVANVKKDPGPIVLIHYFGFSQPGIRALARHCCDQGWVLIEDCAHALFSRDGDRPLGEYAPVSIYSLHKSLPVGTGGALRVDAELLRSICGKTFQIPRLRRFSPQPYIRFIKDELRQVAGEGLVALFRKVSGKPKLLPGELAPPALEVHASREDHISYMSRRIANSADGEAIRGKRRHNYAMLDEHLKSYRGYSRVFKELPGGTCPLCLPIQVSRRSGVLRQLRQENITPFVFGAHPHPLLRGHRDNVRLRDRILGLPVHQQLRDADIMRIAEVVGPLLPDHGPGVAGMSKGVTRTNGDADQPQLTQDAARTANYTNWSEHA
jgi:hypothetical protein